MACTCPVRFQLIWRNQTSVLPGNNSENIVSLLDSGVSPSEEERCKDCMSPGIISMAMPFDWNSVVS